MTLQAGAVFDLTSRRVQPQRKGEQERSKRAPEKNPSLHTTRKSHPPCGIALLRLAIALHILRPSMDQTRDHGVENQSEEDHSQTEEKVAEGTGNAFPAFPFIFDAVLVKPAFRNQAIIPPLPFVLHFLFRDPARENDGVHGKFFDAEMGVEKVNRKDEPGREQRFVRMNNQRDIDEPPRKKSREQH